MYFSRGSLNQSLNKTKVASLNPNCLEKFVDQYDLFKIVIFSSYVQMNYELTIYHQ